MDVTDGFVQRVLTELERRGASGAGRAVWNLAGQLRPLNSDPADERKRLILLADRMATHWLPTTVGLLRDEQLNRLVDLSAPVETADDIQAIEGWIGTVREELRAHVSQGPTPGNAAETASALVPFQKAVRALTPMGEAGLPEETDSALEQLAVGLVNCFELAAFTSFPEEVARTRTILEKVDREAEYSIGAQVPDRIASDHERYRELVGLLVAHLSTNFYPVTHAIGIGTLPTPPLVGRHRPDLIAKADRGDGRAIGLVKLGPDLNDQYSQEQLRDFLDFASTSEGTGVTLLVPKGIRADAHRAAERSGGSTAKLNVIEGETP